MALVVTMVTIVHLRPVAARLPAQTPQIQPSSAQTLPPLREALSRVSYDAEKSGPLLVVAPSTRQRLPGDWNTAPSLRGLANAFDARLIRLGSVTILAPRQITTLIGQPPKPSLLKGLSPSQSLSLLLAMLTEDQWQKLGSENGIGFADLREEQKPLLDALIPGNLSVQRMKTVPHPEKPSQAIYEPVGEPKSGNRGDARLRFNRRLFFWYESAVNRGRFTTSMSAPSPRFGDEFWRLEPSGKPPKAPQEDTRIAAYGALLVPTVANAMKPGQLSFDTPALAAGIPLAASSDSGGATDETLGSLIDRLRAATRLDLRADRRLRSLPVYVRAVPGQTARASDVLQALCWGVGGTFRRIDSRGQQAVFLLTEDVQGIGTRHARITEWAEQAARERRALLDNALKTASALNPLRFIGFAGDDPYAVSSDLSAKIENSRNGFLADVADLPKGVQDRVSREAAGYASDGEPMRTDRVRIEATERLTLVLPGIGAVTDGPPYDSFALAIQEGNLRGSLRSLIPAEATEAEPLPSRTARPVTPAGKRPPIVLPTYFKRRVLLISAGSSPETAVQIVRAARSRGFTEVWLQIPNIPKVPNIPTKGQTGGNSGIGNNGIGNSGTDKEALAETLAETLAFVAAAVRAGKAANIPVGASLSLLQPFPFWQASVKGVPGHTSDSEVERNLLGETAAEFVARLERESPSPSANDRWERLWYGGWRKPEETTVRQAVASIARIPGLSGLLIRAATPPGYSVKPPYQNPTLASGEMGYTTALRRAFLDKEGVDPLDIPEQFRGGAGIMLNLPFFPLELTPDISGDASLSAAGLATWGALWDTFRQEQNRRSLTALWDSVRADHASLPLYLGQPSFAANRSTRAWYQSWDAPGALPRDQFGPGEEARAAVRRQSRAALFSVAPSPLVLPRVGSGALPMPDPAEVFARRCYFEWVPAQTEGWDGVVVDVSCQEPSQQIELIRGFAEVAPVGN
ncbi:MAG: hypothetical protein V4671_31560 [Armatimonadota bacterium]